MRFGSSILLTFLLLAVAAADILWFTPANQTYAKTYLEESLALSATTYATCRVINGGVSSIQESSISISPYQVWKNSLEILCQKPKMSNKSPICCPGLKMYNRE